MEMVLLTVAEIALEQVHHLQLLQRQLLQRQLLQRQLLQQPQQHQ
jgi:hypothetical protein